MDGSNAKAEIDKLRNDVSNGTKRVYVNAKCPNPKRIPSKAEAMKAPHDLVKQLNKIIGVSENDS